MRSRAALMTGAMIVAVGSSACAKWNEQHEQRQPQVLMTDAARLPIAESAVWCDTGAEAAMAKVTEGNISIQIELPASYVASAASERDETFLVVKVGVARAPEDTRLLPRDAAAETCPIRVETRM